MSAALKHAYRTIIKLTQNDADRYREYRSRGTSTNDELIEAEQANREAVKGLALLESQK